MRTTWTCAGLVPDSIPEIVTLFKQDLIGEQPVSSKDEVLI